MMSTRLGAGAFLAAMLLAGAAFGQAFPSKTVRFVLPNANVGLPDALARLAAGRMSESMGQPVVVENRPSAGGLIAGEIVAKAPPDGYTLLLFGNGEYAVSPALYGAKMPYDAARDFAPVTQAIRGTYYLVANAALGVSTTAELIALARSRPGMNYGSPGNGQVPHLALAQFARLAGVQMTHIPYKGVAQSLPALLAGDVSITIIALQSVLPHIKAGKLRVLAAASAQRSSLMPEVPTLAEAGLAGFDVQISLGFFVPAGTPRPVIDRLNAEFARALKAPDTAAKLSSFGTEVVAGTPEQFGERIRADQEYYGRLVREMGLKVD